MLDPSHFRDFEDPDFARKCESFGFKMDCGNSIDKLFPRASYDDEVLAGVINQITDIKLLGSAIYSRWRYYTHWTMGDDNYRSVSAKMWFVTAFNRLLVLSAYPTFKGQVNKIVLESEDSLYCPPEPRREIRQRLTLHTNGNVSLTRYYSGDFSQVPPTEDTKTIRRYKGKPTEKVMNYIAEYFREFHDMTEVCDGGVWGIELINTEGQKWSYNGSLCDDLRVGNLGLSHIVRNVLGLPELWMFDGEMDEDITERRTIDDFMKGIAWPKVILCGETEHFFCYRKEHINSDVDEGIPLWIVENKVANVFFICGADASKMISDHFYGGSHYTEKDVENAIAYDVMKCETISDERLYQDTGNMLFGIGIPVSPYCKSCIHSEGDSPYNDGPDKVQCQMYYNEYDFKPFEIMFKGAACGFFEEE